MTKIVKIEDTREQEIIELPGGKEKKVGIPGTGSTNECDHCGSAHEIHVHLDNGKIIGLGCARKVGLKKEIDEYEFQNLEKPWKLEFFFEEARYGYISREYWKLTVGEKSIERNTSLIGAHFDKRAGKWWVQYDSCLIDYIKALAKKDEKIRSEVRKYLSKAKKLGVSFKGFQN